MKLNRLLLLGIVLLGLMISFNSCRKKADTIVKIYIKDASTNAAISGATVTLDASSSQAVAFPVDDTKFPFVTTSNSSGEAVFNLNSLYELGQAGVAVLDIQASSGGSTGKGVIKVVEETTSEETVFL